MNLEIPRKSEAWKFSPLSRIQSLDLKVGSEMAESDFEMLKLAMGPTEQQIHTIHVQDLVDAGTAEIFCRDTTDYFYEDSNTIRAKLDRSLENISNSKAAVVLKLLKSPQSTIWLNPNAMGRNVEIEIESGVNANLVFFETNSEDAREDTSSFYKTSFIVKDEAYLELGLSKSSAKNSMAHIDIELGTGAHFNSYALMTGPASYKRLEINIFQKGAGSSATLNGLNATHAKSIFDYHSNIFHLNKDQQTFQNFKAVCKDNSKSIFSGRVHLTESCSGASVDQMNHNLLLDKTSSIDTQPELNIYHDNVKATHGATTSSLDEDHIFYFSSRGFKPEHTKKILLEAFCNSTCDNLKNSGIQKFFKDAISKELFSDDRP